jgi:hypothetical protein
VIANLFEGPAGSGKTHQLVDQSSKIAEVSLADEHCKLLALTFMNGARRRLEARLGRLPRLRGRFVCSTFDSFAASLIHRRRSQLRGSTPINRNAFDDVCAAAATLLQMESVAKWVATSYPVVAVDESQDLDAHRFRLLQGLAKHSLIIAAADEFQNLREDVDSQVTMEWLRSANTVTPLTTVRRTSRDGLLRVAGALRAGTSVTAELSATEEKPFSCFTAPGVRFVQVPEKHLGGVAWTVANELSKLSPRAVILTPDGSGDRINKVLNKVKSESFARNKKAGTTFGPFDFAWEAREADESSELFACFPAGDIAIEHAVRTSKALNTAEGDRVAARLERRKNIRGTTTIGGDALRLLIEEVIRDSSRRAERYFPGRRAMTIHRAKNREFAQVLVLWPQTVTGSAEHQRRLLYNAVTRAQVCCSVVVFGQDRLTRPPFAVNA